MEGRIRTRSYDDKDGNKRYITEIYGDVMQLLGTRQDNQAGINPVSETGTSEKPAIEADIDDPGGDEDLPF